MDRNGFLSVILIFLIVADSSNASFVWNFRKLIGVKPNDNSTVAQESNTTTVDTNKSGKEKSNDPLVKSNSSNEDPKGLNSNDKTGSESRPSDKQIDKGKNHKDEEKSDNTASSQFGTNGSCEGFPKSCRDQKTILACIQSLGNVSEESVILVHNEGEITLNVNITIRSLVDNVLQPFAIPKHHIKTINVPLTAGKNTKIIINAGNGDCVLDVGPPDSEGNLFQQLSFYSKQVTPIYGAYFLFLVLLIFGGTWACCKLNNRRRHDGVPYQELEMGLPESASAVNVDTAEGWDHDWDDDWDEDKAVKSPGGHHVGNISANGLTSRSSKRDGWENDWDD